MVRNEPPNLTGWVVYDDYKGILPGNLILFKDRNKAVNFAVDILLRIDTEQYETYGCSIFGADEGKAVSREQEAISVLREISSVTVPVKGSGYHPYATIMIVPVVPDYQ